MSVALKTIQGGAAVLDAIDRAKQGIAGKRTYAALLTLTTQFDLKRTAPMEAMFRFASAWEGGPITESGGPAEFLEYLELFREAGGTVALANDERSNAVRLMTAHSAKGLEFDHVFILRAVSNSFPASYREPLIETPAELRNSQPATSCDEKELHKQEERRLFYVAMTRARDTLAIYGQYGRGEKDRTPPGFVRELIKDRGLTAYFSHRTCRAFQTEIFAAGEASSRIAEWINLPADPALATTLSASAIQRYEICPLQFKLERQWRIPSEVSAALQYGAAMHRVLLSYYLSVRQNRPIEEATLLELFSADLASAGLADSYQHELYEKKGRAELREFLATAGSADREVLHTEEQFNIKVGETNLVGRIDRIDRTAEGGIVITDYKTGRPKSQEDADESLQLSLYALAAREKWGYKAERLVFHNLEGNTAIVTARSEGQIEEAKMRVEDIAQRIADGQFEPKLGIHCFSCAYRNLCPKTERAIPQLLAAAADQKK
jgi:RecB family exonuclease